MTAAAQSKLRLVSPPPKPDPIFGARARHELEFLPAALEVIETPPPPLPRVAALTLVALLVSALAWASFGQVDVVSAAAGKLVAAGGGKVVQPLETGAVTAIRVQDGAVVHKGDVLVELEPTETLADQMRLTNELAAARLNVARLRAAALGEPFRAPPGSDPGAAALARREAQAEIADRNAKIQGLNQQIAQHRAELDQAQAEEARLRTLIPIAEQRLQVFESLGKQGYGSRLQLFDAEEKQRDTIQSLAIQRAKAPEIQAAINGAIHDRDQAAADAAKNDLSDLTDAQVKAASLADDLNKAQERLKDRTLTAPVDGVVQELTIHTIGGVVEPGQTLMRIEPTGAGVEVEAKLLNKDVGFVRAGMPAEIKIETFPFTRYGVVHATVTGVSRDAIVESPQTSQPPQDQSQPQPGDLRYLVRLKLSRGRMMIDGRMVDLTPGMMVTAEIKTGHRRVIDYIFSPLAKTTEEAGRER